MEEKYWKPWMLSPAERQAIESEAWANGQPLYVDKAAAEAHLTTLQERFRDIDTTDLDALRSILRDARLLEQCRWLTPPELNIHGAPVRSIWHINGALELVIAIVDQIEETSNQGME